MTKTVTLTQIEATGIQDYIFGSNNLRQNVGASELVARATTQWVAQALDGLGGKHNATWNDSEGRLDLADQSIAASGVQAEVIYAGGGNALILFEGKAHGLAQDFTRNLTFKVLEQARGLTLVVEHLDFEWDSVVLSEKHQELRRKVAARKMKRPISLPLPGRAVTAACEFTGLPAVGLDKLDNDLISEQVRCKVDIGHSLANGRLHNILRNVRKNGYEFAHDFDLFGEKGESSYIAVIHADGNGIGKRFKAIAKEHPSSDDNEAYVRQLRAFSQAMREKSVTSLRETVDLLMGSRETGEDGKERFGGEVLIPKEDRKTGKQQEYLPFRPIVFGGDDVTFVAEGRLGLAMAAHYLNTVSQGPLPGPKAGVDGDPLYSRAGVAVVKSHYPFSRAYELAEALAASAKSCIDYLADGKGTVMDWHFSTSGVILSLKQVREREYIAETGNSLLMRPVRLNLGEEPPPGSKYWRSWETFVDITRAFQDEKPWAGRRNRIKALQGAPRGGPDAVEQFRANYGVEELPEIPMQSTMKTTGWAGGDCGYFDAIEALDFYVHLSSGKEAV